MVKKEKMEVVYILRKAIFSLKGPNIMYFRIYECLLST